MFYLCVLTVNCQDTIDFMLGSWYNVIKLKKERMVVMNSVHISEFYPCSKITLACELYYVCELGKYLRLKYDRSLSLDGILFGEGLEKSALWDYFRLAVDQGWLEQVGMDKSKIEVTIQQPLVGDLKSVCNVLYGLEEVPFDMQTYKRRHSDLAYAYREPERLQVSFESRSADCWLWSMEGENGKGYNINSKSLFRDLARQCWLSLVAFVAVERCITGEPEKLGIRFSQSVVMNNITAISYIDLLSEYTECLSGWCYYTKDESIFPMDALQLGYVSWYMRGMDYGMLSRWYTAKEKRAYMAKLGIGEGDIVAFYAREKAQKNNYIKTVASYHTAKIMKIKERSIVLQLINTTKTKAQGEEDFANKTMAVKAMYLDKSYYEKLNSRVEEFDLNDCGVEYMMYGEWYFILPLTECNDSRVMRVGDDSGRRDLLVLPQNDLVYWILKEYGVEFNEDHFLETLFPNSEPAYTVYMRGDALPDSYYYKGGGKA